MGFCYMKKLHLHSYELVREIIFFVDNFFDLGSLLQSNSMFLDCLEPNDMIKLKSKFIETVQGVDIFGGNNLVCLERIRPEHSFSGCEYHGKLVMYSDVCPLRRTFKNSDDIWKRFIEGCRVSRYIEPFSFDLHSSAISSISRYHLGLLHGCQVFFNEERMISERVYWKHGVRVESVYYSPDGDVVITQYDKNHDLKPVRRIEIEYHPETAEKIKSKTIYTYRYLQNTTNEKYRELLETFDEEIPQEEFGVYRVHVLEQHWELDGRLKSVARKCDGLCSGLQVHFNYSHPKGHKIISVWYKDNIPIEKTVTINGYIVKKGKYCRIPLGTRKWAYNGKTQISDSYILVRQGPWEINTLVRQGSWEIIKRIAPEGGVRVRPEESGTVIVHYNKGERKPWIPKRH
jgi:hypothetical protein